MDLGRMWFIRDAAGHEAKKMAVGSTVFLRKGVLRPGDYVYPANEIGGATGIINLGPRELHFRADARFAEIYLPGGEFKAGDKLEMNYLIFGRDARPELQNNDEWLQKYVDDFGIGREKAAYTFALKQGKPLSVAFGLGAEAVDGGAVFEIGKADLPHDLPLTVKVPAANAVYGHFSGRDKTLLMLEAIDGEVHSAVVTNHGAESAYVGELLRVDNPALRLDAVINGENELLLEIHNISAQKQRGAFTACSMFQAPAPIELAPGKSAILKLKGEFKPYAKK